MNMQTRMSPLTFFRLCLSGALAGAALVGAIAPFFGVHPTHEGELAGCVMGACAVAALKFTHVI